MGVGAITTVSSSSLEDESRSGEAGFGSGRLSGNIVNDTYLGPGILINDLSDFDLRCLITNKI